MEKTQKPLVSVIIPAYNAENFLSLAIDSLLGQTYTDFEAIIIDDGSTDTTKEVTARFLSDPRIRYFQQENCGVSAARNAGAAKARGTYLALLDADDIWHPEKLAQQIQGFADDPEIGLVYSNISTIDDQGNIIREQSNRFKCFSGWVTSQLIAQNFIPGPSVILKRDYFIQSGGFKTSLSLSEDYELWLRLSTLCKFQHINACLCQYRRHDNQASTQREEHLLAHITAIEIFLAEYPAHITRKQADRAIADTLKNLGHFYLKTMRDKQRARQSFWRAISLSPGYMSVWNRLIRSYLQSVG